jgi:transmembrane sensor
MRITDKKRARTNAIEDRAAAWVSRLDKGAMAPAARGELDAWLAEDARHRGAFLRAEAAWKNLDRIGFALGDEPDMSLRNEWISRRGLLAAGGGAAALVATAAAVVFVLAGRHQIQTPLGEIRRVPLGDGSLVAVNTNSALEIALKAELREVTLDKGEVWFDVAKDNKRPFIVAAGDVRVRAVGTAFSVHRLDDGADVLVTEGIVETWTVGAENRRRRVSAGSKVFVSDIDGPSNVVAAATQIDRTLAWRDGEIVLDGETLADAAAEFNRYNDRKLTIDPALTNQRFVGWFHTNEPETFAQAVVTALGATVVVRENEIHLEPRLEP